MIQEMKKERISELCRRVGAEGAVLLKNEAKVLPLKKEDKIAVFGRIQLDYYRSGTGSGGAVNVPYQVNLVEGLKNNGVRLEETLLETYQKWQKEHPFDNGGGGWAAEPWFQQEMPLSDELVKKTVEHADKALVVIGRTAGEDKDNSDVAGSYLLTEDERQMLTKVCESFDKVIVVLNVSNIIDMSWQEETLFQEKIKAVVYAWHGGMEGGNAVADVLTGCVTPSGKLPDTIAYHIEDYPSTAHFAGSNDIVYAEDIYVGYRYFETFAPEKVQYPFGFGLSYTDFSIEVSGGKVEEDVLKVKLAVCNTGTEFSGKEVVQLYYEAPQGKLGKAKRVLGTYAKTTLLQPGESQEICLELPLEAMASYDDSGVTGYPFSYVLEEGNYQIYVGNSLRNLVKVCVDGQEGIYIPETRVISKYEQALAPEVKFERLKTGDVSADGIFAESYEPVPLQKVDMQARILNKMPKELPITGDCGIKLQDVADKKATMEEFVAQLTEEDLAIIVRGEGMCSPKVTAGTAAAFGGVTEKLAGYGISIACAADGPSGVRMEDGTEASLVPIGTALAASWNNTLVEDVYEQVGLEMLKNGVDTLLGPGINIHRNPLNGRNFEYFSEDPLLTGKMASAVIKGIQKNGATATVKHFACNNRETSRSFTNSIVSERALREIYLKGFELAVKEGGAISIMTSYNAVNGHWAASNYDLNTTILREEWGYSGMVMTDWWAVMNDPIKGGEPERTNTAAMVRAQNDVYMVIDNDGAQVNTGNDNTMEALQNHQLELGELQRSAMNVCRYLMQTPAFKEGRLFKVEYPVYAPLAENISEGEDIAAAEGHIPININEGKRIFVKEDGRYRLTTRLSCDQILMAQVTCKLILNNSDEIAFQITGTQGEWSMKNITRFQLSAGVYELKIQGSGPKIVTDWIELVKVE